MFRLTSKISITNKIGEIFTLDFIENVEVSSSWDTMPDTATVQLPKNIYVMKDNTPNLVSLSERTIAAADPTGLAEKADKPLFEVGDIIKIELGYDFNYNKVFEGFITDVSATVPIVLKCEDPMWLLGRIKFEEDLDDSSPLTFAELLAAIQEKFLLNTETILWKAIWPELLGITFIPNLIGGLAYTLSNFSVKGKTILEIMQALKNEYQLYFYYKLSPEEHVPGIIYCGEYYNINLSQSPKKFHFQNNVISADQLINQKESVIKRNVKAINIEDAGLPDKNIEVLVGNPDPTSNTTTITVYKIDEAISKAVNEVGSAIGNAVGGAGSDIATAISNNANTLVVKQMLINIANRKLRTFYYNGYSGYFTTFGKPLVVHGDTVQLIDDYVRDRNGSFKVKQVDYSFGKGGFRQKIYLHFSNDIVSAFTSTVSNISSSVTNFLS